MATFLVRVELPDRPGALGAVASRIGAVHADVTAVEVVERREDSAVDEFVVELADENHLSLLLSEIVEVDGVSVQEVHPVAGHAPCRTLDAYATALAIVRERTPQTVLSTLASRVRTDLDAAWTAVLDMEQVLTVATHGRPPSAAWLAGMVEASRAGATHPAAGAGDVGWAHLAAWDLVLAAGRPGLRFGPREEAHLAAVAQLADARWVDLAEREGRDPRPGTAD